jgi:mRNA interferase MazF
VKDSHERHTMQIFLSWLSGAWTITDNSSVAHNMQQGDIWFANLNPAKGSEQAGRRPVVIVSGDTLNDTMPIIIVVPVTSQLKSYPTCVLLLASKTNGLTKDSEAIPFQIRTLSKKRLTKKIGRVTADELREILKGLFLTLTH